MARKHQGLHSGIVQKLGSAHRVEEALEQAVIVNLQDKAFAALPGNMAPEAEGSSFLLWIRVTYSLN
jgi:hypothetical protein